MSTDRELTFRITWVRPWLLALIVMSTALFLIACLGAAAGQAGAWIAFGLGLAVASVVALVCIVIGAATLRWHVDADGIGGPNNWHVVRQVGWSEIASVSPWPIPGYRLVQVNSRSRRRVFWLPLFFTDMEGFRKAVARYAPPDNPLRRYLEEHPAEGSRPGETT
jgi:hypothetical protein